MSESISTNTTMKSINDFNGYTFVIPHYQRGFRWSRRNIKDLVDDLIEFAQDGNKQDYCMQPIVVKKCCEDKDEYEVIDGQQRLTAIWILSKLHYALRHQKSEYDKTYIVSGYNLKYQNKDSYQQYIYDLDRVLFSTDKNRDSEKVLYNELTSEICIDDKEDIDSRCLQNIIYYLLNEYSDMNDHGLYAAADDYLLRKSYGGINKSIRFIWQEVSEDNNSNLSAIEKFTNINANKIPLTNAELTKAYFIKALGKFEKPGKDYVTEFTLQWEAIDRSLSNDKFWCFFSSAKDNEETVQTRIDLLLKIWLNSQDAPDDQYFISREINNILTAPDVDPEKVWKEIVAIHDTLCDWYEDYYCYHLIGLLIEVSDSNKVSSGEIISGLYHKYNSSTKSEFKALLKEQIRTSMHFLFPVKDENGNNIVADQLTIKDQLESLSYSDQEKKKLIKPALLCFNIALLVSGYDKNPQNSAERFPFDFYKNRDNNIEIEHINPQHLEGKNSNKQEYSPEDKRKWAEACLNIIPLEQRDDLREKIEKAYKQNKFDKLITEIEAKAKIHSFANLTLLDKNLNIRYGDNFFDEKRKHIIAARFGLAIPGNPDKKYTQSVIFPGTMWVFMRQYIEHQSKENDKDKKIIEAETEAKVTAKTMTESAAEEITCGTAAESTPGTQADTDTPASVGISNRWTDHDKEEYLSNMSSYIFNLLCAEKKNDEVTIDGK